MGMLLTDRVMGDSLTLPYMSLAERVKVCWLLPSVVCRWAKTSAKSMNPILLPISVKPFSFRPSRESRARFSLLRFTRSISRGHPSLSRLADEVVSVQAARPALAVSEIFTCRLSG